MKPVGFCQVLNEFCFLFAFFCEFFRFFSFSGLFSGTGAAAHPSVTQDVQTVNVRYSGSTKQVLPGTDPLIRKKAEKPKAFDFLDAE